METEKKLRNISIAGAGMIKGGEYDRVNIAGTGKISGDIQANVVKISGAGLVDGNVRAGDVTISGSAKIHGSVRTEQLTNNGSLSIEEEVQAYEIINNGSIIFHDSLKGSKVTSRGSFIVKDEMIVDEFKSIGSFWIKGSLAAKKIDVEISGKCEAEQIHCEDIEVTPSVFSFFTAIARFFVMLFTGKSTLLRLKTKSIEAKRIVIENVEAEVIRGEDVVIGPKCEIGLVEYQNAIKVHPSAKVNQQVKIS